jgi:hypothetical protein
MRPHFVRRADISPAHVPGVILKRTVDSEIDEQAANCQQGTKTKTITTIPATSMAWNNLS